MDSVLDSLAQHAPAILMALCLLVLGLGVIVVRMSVALSRQRSQWRSLMQGTSGENLERLLFDHLRERVELESKLESCLRRIAALEAKAGSFKRHLGVVRYDAFEDVGGAQSFALALFDDLGDGLVMNGIVGRSDCRVYCKSLVRGKSDRSLTPEERKAIELAAQSVEREPVRP